MKYKVLLSSAAVVFALSGCDGPEDGQADNKPATQEQVVAALKTSWVLNGNALSVDTQSTYPSGNLEHIARNDEYGQCLSGTSILCAIDPNNPPVERMTIRYPSGPNNQIPVYYNINSSTGKPDAKDPRFEKAMQNINEIVGFELFKDMGYIRIDHDPVGYEPDLDYSSVDGKGGLIFSVGTSVMQEENQCGHGSFSKGPNTMETGTHLLDSDNYFAADKGWSWINLDSSDGTCIADEEICSGTVNLAT